ncbi:MAG: signal peptide peptidase SppA [Acidobacteria bacterium]|nr:signal peptide peptidase SppA [Acidobacteriota bacterium]
MAKAHRYFIGAGCLLLVFGMVIFALLVKGLSAPPVPRQAFLTLRLAGPIEEVTADDPLADMMGEHATSLRKLRDVLLRAAEDDRIEGLRLRIDSIGGGFATAQEIRSLISRVSAAGKWTSAYMETAGEFSSGNLVYYVASSCDEIVMNPQGDLNLIGLSASSPFIRGTFDKLDIRSEFPGRGDYKTARFMYTQTEFTPAHREMTGWLLDSIMDQIVRDIADSRSLEPEAVRALIDEAPFLGGRSKELGFVDRMEDWSAFVERLEQEHGTEKSVTARSYLKHVGERKRGPKIGVVTAVGTIMRGPSGESYNPLFGGKIMGSDTISKAFQHLRDTDGIKAVIFRVDSPGGSAVASEIIRQEMNRTAREVPVVVSMSNLAASGGYWISCGAQRIVADPGTLTGSIGVYAGHLNASGFYRNKLGVTFGRLDRGLNANIYGELEDWTDVQRAAIDGMLDRIYDDFVERVSQSRNMAPEAVDAIGRGRVFTGPQALEKGLIDVLGGFDTALAEAKTLADIDPDTEVQLVDFPRVLPWWQQLARRRSGDGAALEKRLEVLEQFIATGSISTPGVVWMPPITIE